MSIRLAIDPGHGMSNRVRGLFDPGAVANGQREADIALRVAQELAEILPGYGVETWLTRTGNADSAPLGKRVARAQAEGCTHLLSLHCNAFNGKASGTETYRRNAAPSGTFTSQVHQAALMAFGLRDRGEKLEGSSQHSRLAILAFPQSCLLEIGFIDHSGDLRAMTTGANIGAFAHRLGQALTGNKPKPAPPDMPAPALVNGHEVDEWEIRDGEAWLNMGLAAAHHGWAKRFDGRRPSFDVPPKAQ
jgi:N-acetylmuramoyl-L-alanine amidase